MIELSPRNANLQAKESIQSRTSGILSNPFQSGPKFMHMYILGGTGQATYDFALDHMSGTEQLSMF